MSVSSILYQSARNRFNSPIISKSIVAQSVISVDNSQKVIFKGYNPDTDKQVFENKMGENVEAINNNQGKIFQSNQTNSIVYQGNVVG